MSQTFTDDCFAGAHVAQTDMTNIEANMAALKSSFSGSSAPSNPVPGMPWFDTANEVPRFRDPDDAEWLALMPCDDGDEGSGAKGYIWLYRNNTVDGMVVDTAVSDRVLAVKGGSSAYNVNGGTTAGTAFSSLSGHTHSHSHTTTAHSHKWYDNLGSYATHKDGSGANITLGTITDSGKIGLIADSCPAGGSIETPGADLYTDSQSPATGTNAAASNISDARPAAAVGTLQRPDI